MDLKSIEFKLLRGDSVTTRELKHAHLHFGRLREDLGSLGQRWHFAFSEANRLWVMTGQYLTARGHKAFEALKTAEEEKNASNNSRS